MRQTDASESGQELSALCDTVRELIRKNAYQECEKLVTAAMGRYPHAPQPHNLIGILLEKMDDRISAMKHFRAAQALDPTYLPARHNVDRFASFYPGGACAFDETDCFPKQTSETIRLAYDGQGIGHVVVFGKCRLNIAEIPIVQTAPIAGKKVWEIDLPQEVTIGCILRGDQNIAPRGDTRILAGDVLILISAGKQEMPAIQKWMGRS